jgi:hypothetical protein
MSLGGPPVGQTSQFVERLTLGGAAVLVDSVGEPVTVPTPAPLAPDVPPPVAAAPPLDVPPLARPVPPPDDDDDGDDDVDDDDDPVADEVVEVAVP